MARKPDTPCAGGCGTMLWGGTTSLPKGSRTCRSCRARGLAPERVAQPTKRKFRACDIEDCGRVHLARGLCKKHYSRLMKSLQPSRVPVLHLNAVCSRWFAAEPKVKRVKCRHTIGIMPWCPSCGALMRPFSADHFWCAACGTDAQFNPDEVSWLAS